jgi:hypothetical protein
MNAGGWPGEPGVPLNPEAEETLHLLGGEPFLWRGDGWWSIEPGNEGYITRSHAVSKSYGGPLYTEAQVAARVEEEREACARKVEAQICNVPHLKARDYPDDMGRLIEDAAHAIRARGTRPSQAEGEGS